MATPHIAANPGDFAPAVIFPGDPLRAKAIASQLMPHARLINDVRGMLAYTGTYRGQPLSVMGSGMGMPSATIYATELFEVYGVQRIVRVGTCGGISPEVSVGDIVVAMGAHTDSNMNQQRIPGVNFSAVASFNLARAALDAADGSQRIRVGTVVSQDHFYFKGDDPTAYLRRLADHHVLGLEMEAAGIYGVAAQFGREALAVMTVSDNLLDPSSNMTAEERATQFQGALRLGVAAALS